MGVFLDGGLKPPVAQGCAIPVAGTKHQARTVPRCAGFSFATGIFEEL